MRINEKDLKEKIEALNEISGFKSNPDYSTIGSYTLSCAYGGYSLHKYTGKNGSVIDVFNSGHITKKELFNKISSFISGIHYEKDRPKKLNDLLRDIPKVSNMINDRGNTIPNQFLIHTNKGIFFQSYNSIIAFKPYGNDKIVLDTETWDYSRTTGKYRNLFLRENKEETQKKIDNGTYELANLN